MRVVFAFKLSLFIILFSSVVYSQTEVIGYFTYGQTESGTVPPPVNYTSSSGPVGSLGYPYSPDFLGVGTELLIPFNDSRNVKYLLGGFYQESQYREYRDYLDNGHYLNLSTAMYGSGVYFGIYGDTRLKASQYFSIGLFGKFALGYFAEIDKYGAYTDGVDTEIIKSFGNIGAKFDAGVVFDFKYITLRPGFMTMMRGEKDSGANVDIAFQIDLGVVLPE